MHMHDKEHVNSVKVIVYSGKVHMYSGEVHMLPGKVHMYSGIFFRYYSQGTLEPHLSLGHSCCQSTRELLQSFARCIASVGRQ